VPPGACGEGLIPYTIRAGDTLYALARQNNVSVEVLLRLNPGIDPNSLRVGQTVCLPPPGATQPSTVNCPPGLTRYRIQPGDTFYSIAAKSGTTVARIESANPGVNPNSLIVGQLICIPGPTPAPGVCPAPSRQYVVQPGDTFYSIAQKFAVSVARIEGANPAVNPNNLMPGQVICIPGA
jgi:LysM repeat protein